MNVRRFTFAALLLLAGVGSLVALQAGGQDPNDAPGKTPVVEERSDGVVVEARADGTLVERTVDGKILRALVNPPAAGKGPQTYRAIDPLAPHALYPVNEAAQPVDPKAAANIPSVSTIIEQRPDGVVVERTVDGKVLRMQKGLPGLPPGMTQAVADGRSVSVVQFAPQPLDAQSQKLLADEQALAQEVRKLANNLTSIEMPAENQAEQKKAIREKLAAIFDLQQQRRTREIAKIEERLGKLKDVLKNRETAKDSIVDRRLESITGGVDELGWEESLPLLSYEGRAFGVPTLQPRLAPGTQPGLDTVTPGVGPAADLPPTIPGPDAIIPPAAVPTPAPPTRSAPSTIPAPPRIPSGAPSDDAPAATLRSRY